jgi:hypothetical protein
MRLFVVSMAAVSVAQCGAVEIQPRSDVRQHNTRAFMVGGQDNPLGGGELTSTLARLDRQWKIQQRSAAGKSRWTKLILPDENAPEEEVTEQDPTMDTQQDFVYLLEPPNSIPSCLIVFVGGAGLGAYPQIADSETLMRISNKLNAAVLAAPYQVGLDHFSLAANDSVVP